MHGASYKLRYRNKNTMSNHVYNASEHDNVAALLPWFVNRTLESHEHELVTMHLEECAECRREILLLKALNESIQDDANDSHASHADVEKSLAGVMNRIDGETQKEEKVASAGIWIQQKLNKLYGFFTGLSFPQQGLTALAAVLVAALGFQLYNGQLNNDYSVLSASDTGNPVMRLSVETIPAADQGQVHSIIQLGVEEFDNTINIKMNSAGGYVVEFDGSISVVELSELVEALENESQIKRVEVLP